MVKNYCPRFKKVTGVVFIILFLAQISSFLLTEVSVGKLPDETSNITPNNPIPVYPPDYLVVKDDVMCRGGNEFLTTYEIQIYDVSDPTNQVLSSTYNIQSYFIGSDLLTYQIFDDMLFCIVECLLVNDTDIIDRLVCLEIVNISKPQFPELLSILYLNDTINTKTQFESELDYRMIFADDFLYLSVFDNHTTSTRKGIRVIDCQDPSNPNETARLNFMTYELTDYYVIADRLYVLANDNYIRVYNCTDITNFSFLDSFWVGSDTFFIGHYEENLYVYKPFARSLIACNITNKDVITDSIEQDLVKYYTQLRVRENYLYAVLDETFSIIDISNFASSLAVGFFTAKARIDYLSFRTICLDSDRAIISSIASSENALYYFFDISDLHNPILLFPNERSFNFPIPVTSIVFGLFIISLFSYFFKKIKRSKKN